MKLKDLLRLNKILNYLEDDNWYKIFDAENEEDIEYKLLEREEVQTLLEERKILAREIERLHSIIKEVREQINKDRKKYDYEKDGLMKQEFYCNKTNKLLEILDKVGSDKE